jgi:adenylylsulfate kinase-like enzyme
MNEDGTKVYWLIRMAGTGKTTIAYSFCERLKSCGALGAA